MTDENNEKDKDKEKGKEKEEEASSSNLPLEDSNKLIADANAVAQRIEDANSKTAEIAERMEKAAVDKALGGTADAGQSAVKEKESDADYADKVMKGEANPLKEDGYL